MDCVTLDPTLGLVHVDGRDLTASLIEARTQETFANRTASEITTLLAQRHNLTPKVSSTTTPVGRYYQSEHDRTTLDQFSRATTEWDLLVFLARQANLTCSLKAKRSISNPRRKRPRHVRSAGGRDRSQTGEIVDTGTRYRGVVKSWNSRQNNAFVQIARAYSRSSGSVERIVAALCFCATELRPDDALKLAQRKLAELTRHERTVRISMPGELSLTPRSMIAVEGTARSLTRPTTSTSSNADCAWTAA